MPPAWFSPVGRWASLLLSSLLAKLQEMIRSWLLWAVSAGPIPSHIAFIMDGNRRFADRIHVDRHIGHSHGYDALLRTLKDCFDLHVKTVTLFAFSIDNFQRPPDEVSALMNLMQIKLEALIKKEGLASEYGIRVRILGDLSLLPHGARIAAEKAMAVTSKNNSAVLNLCISYTSTNEIMHSIQRTCGNVVGALGVVDGFHGALDSNSVATCNHRRCDVPRGNGNGHAAVPRMARDTCTSDYNPKSVDGSGELMVGYTVNGEQDYLLKRHKWHDVVGNSDNVCLNACHSTLDGCGIYDECGNFGYAHATTCCNGWDADRAVDKKDREYLCENGLSITQNEGLDNREVSATDVMAGGSKTFCDRIRSSLVSTCEVADIMGLRNRMYKKTGVLENSTVDNTRRELFLSKGTYSGKLCLNDSIHKLVRDCVSEKEIGKHLYTDPCRPPDLLIRTSGETRLSNFLLWQTSFSHLAFCRVLWPEFSFRHLILIILEYQTGFPSLLRKQQNNNIAMFIE